MVKPEVLYLRNVVADLENLLQRALGERIELRTRYSDERVAIEMDPGQLEQVLVVEDEPDVRRMAERMLTKNGKVATPDQILRKQGPLTAEERKEMERHTTVGYAILSDSELLRLAATIALTHHERWDGSGYPQGLAGEAIPHEGRITAVADVFDAVLSDRCTGRRCRWTRRSR